MSEEVTGPYERNPAPENEAGPERPPIDPAQARFIAQFVRQEIRQDIKHEVHQHWAEELPPADDLIRLEEANKGTIGRVLDYMDREQENRDRLAHRAADFDDTRLAESVKFHRNAQMILGVIAVLAIGGGIAVILAGHGAAGIAAVVSALGALSLAFLWGRAGNDDGDTRSGPENA